MDSLVGENEGVDLVYLNDFIERDMGIMFGIFELAR